MQVSDIPVEFRVGEINDDDHRALKSLHRGDATPYQQQLALTVIVNKIARAQDILYVPGSNDATAFLNGRAFVGQQLLKFLNLPVGKMKEVEDNE